MKDFKGKIILIMLIIMIFMGVFPPWKQAFKFEEYQNENPAGYGFIFSPPRPHSIAYSVSLDVSRLLVQWVVVILAAGLFIFLSRSLGSKGMTKRGEGINRKSPQKGH
jgi:hypothetical protein